MIYVGTMQGGNHVLYMFSNFITIQVSTVSALVFSDEFTFDTRVPSQKVSSTICQHADTRFV